MINNTIFKNMLDSPVRYLLGRVELYNSSTLTLMCSCHDALKNFTVERTGTNDKFFGYGISHKVNIHLIDLNREIEVSTANSIKVAFGVGLNYLYPFPDFNVTEVNRDEITNELSITGYDAIYKAASHTVSELEIAAPYTIRQYAAACAAILGLSLEEVDDSFDLEYTNGANFDGAETIRDALDAIAEATQTIYYINKDSNLAFKRLDIDGAAIFTIDKEKYFSLDNSTNRRLVKLVHATELGDNISADLGISGSTQYVRNNPFWDMREEVDTLLETALNRIGGLTINQFECKWRGNFLLELGDKIELITKDNDSVYSYMLNDTLTYDGSLSESTKWSYKEDEADAPNNPTNLGEALKQTYAKVDKINKQIDLVASETALNKESIASIQINTDEINASVKRIETANSEALESINNDLATLTSQVEAKVSAEDVKIEIQTELANGVTKVKTSTGFTFDEAGLSVEKSGSEMRTLISENGMQVYKDDIAVLTANNIGVDAANLHATTYLIIGNNSRFEDYNGNRTGCFWIGE